MIYLVSTSPFFLFVINQKLPFEIHFRPLCAVYHTLKKKKGHQLQLTECVGVCRLMGSHRKICSLTYKLNASPNRVARSSQLRRASVRV
jgi:hypothetical protein